MAFIDRWIGEKSLGEDNALVKFKGDTSGYEYMKKEGSSKSSNEASEVGSASDRIGNLRRAEWDDYVTRFQPRDQQLLEIARGNTDNQQAIDRSLASVGTAFDTSRGSVNRDMSRLGLSSMPDENMQREKSSGLAQRAAEVSAINGARIHTQDRDMKLMSGDMATGLRSGRLENT